VTNRVREICKPAIPPPHPGAIVPMWVPDHFVSRNSLAIVTSHADNSMARGSWRMGSDPIGYDGQFGQAEKTRVSTGGGAGP